MEQTVKKLCFKCGEQKGRGEFYAHPEMADGLLGKCKECTKRDVREHRKAEPELHREIDRRKYVKNREYLLERHAIWSAENMDRQIASNRVYRERWPEKYRARSVVSNALRTGKLQKGPCIECGSTRKVQAHHHDYSKPLDVHWLCEVCHGAEHGKEWYRAVHGKAATS